MGGGLFFFVRVTPASPYWKRLNKPAGRIYNRKSVGHVMIHVYMHCPVDTPLSNLLLDPKLMVSGTGMAMPPGSL